MRGRVCAPCRAPNRSAPAYKPRGLRRSRPDGARRRDRRGGSACGPRAGSRGGRRAGSTYDRSSIRERVDGSRERNVPWLPSRSSNRSFAKTAALESRARAARRISPAPRASSVLNPRKKVGAPPSSPPAWGAQGSFFRSARGGKTGSSNDGGRGRGLSLALAPARGASPEDGEGPVRQRCSNQAPARCGAGQGRPTVHPRRRYGPAVGAGLTRRCHSNGERPHGRKIKSAGQFDRDMVAILTGCGGHSSREIAKTRDLAKTRPQVGRGRTGGENTRESRAEAPRAWLHVRP
jgi:hypothetical protein